MKKMICNKEKEEHFKYFKGDIMGFGRKLSCIKTSTEFRIGVQCEENKRSFILIKSVTDRGKEKITKIENGNIIHQPVLIETKSGFSVLWNEYTKNGWNISEAELNDDAVVISMQTVFASDKLCLPPSCVCKGNSIGAVWAAEKNNGVLSIHFAEKNSGKWNATDIVSEPDINAFRPQICATSRKFTVIWDEYRDRNYQISYRSRTNDEWSKPITAGHPDIRRLNAKLAATPQGKVFAVWIGLKEVSDDKGIADHEAFTECAELTDKGFVFFRYG